MSLLLGTFAVFLISAIWFFCLFTSYSYLHSLFSDMRIGWTRFDRFTCAVLAIAGPAALICGLAVDLVRPVA